jgi:hypothetical protein
LCTRRYFQDRPALYELLVRIKAVHMQALRSGIEPEVEGSAQQPSSSSSSGAATGDASSSRITIKIVRQQAKLARALLPEQLQAAEGNAGEQAAAAAAEDAQVGKVSEDGEIPVVPCVPGGLVRHDGVSEGALKDLLRGRSCVVLRGSIASLSWGQGCWLVRGPQEVLDHWDWLCSGVLRIE